MIQGKIVKFSVVLSTMSLFYGDHKYDWIMIGVNVPDFVVWRMMLHLVLHSCQGLMIRGPVEIWKLWSVLPCHSCLTSFSFFIGWNCVVYNFINLFLRCMTTRRDNPDGSLWRVAVEGFNRIIVDDVSGFTLNCGTDSKISKTASMRIWKEVADVYEIFLVGYCGRAIPSNSLSSEALRADEALEMTILNILGDKILKSPIDAPSEVIFIPITITVLVA